MRRQPLTKNDDPTIPASDPPHRRQYRTCDTEPMTGSDWGNRLSFGLGTLGRDMMAALVSMYLMFYLTDVLLIPASTTVAVTVVIVAMRIFDALNDPIMGVIVDNTRTRWGKFKPWIALGAGLWATGTIALFIDTQLTGTAFLVWFTVVYLLWSVSYTINDISFWGMLPSLSQDLKEREVTGMIARVSANVGLFAVVVALVPVTKSLGAQLGSLQRGWLGFAVILVVLMLAFQLLTLLFTRQKVAAAPVHTPFRELVKVIGRNDQLLWVTASMLCFMGGYMTVTSLGLYYFKYVFRDEDAYPIFTAILAIAQLTGLALFPVLRRWLTRRQLHSLGVALSLAGLTIFWFAGSTMAMVAVSGVLLFTGQAFIQLLMLMFIADCVEYGQWKLGRRNESVTLSVQPFIYKASNAIGSGFVGVALVVSGISGAASVDAVTESGISAFKAVMLLLPMALIAVSWLILRIGYRLDEKRYAEILAELAPNSSGTH